MKITVSKRKMKENIVTASNIIDRFLKGAIEGIDDYKSDERDEEISEIYKCVLKGFLCKMRKDLKKNKDLMKLKFKEIN